jgi:uncharacterized protein with HEPN domain
MFNLAIMRLMEVVGEAAARVPDAFRQRHPAVPWRDIADLRNRLIHGYDTSTTTFSGRSSPMNCPR